MHGGSLVPNGRKAKHSTRTGFSMTHRMLDVAIVADDLTGALDAAAPFAALGLKTRVLLDIDRVASAADNGNTQVLSLTSESRHLSPHAADECVWNATRATLAYAPRVLFKKIDSTLRGNVAAEILAGLRASGLRHALIAPAIPRHGRSMRASEVFVDGVPLGQTLIGAEALSPAPSAPLPQVLRAASKDIIVHVWPRGTAFTLSVEPGIHAYVADCETETDLDIIARFALNHCDEVLPVGASGLATAMARRLVPKLSSRILRPNPRITQHDQKPILFVIGSRTKVSAEQSVRLCAAGAEELVTPLSESERDVELLLDRNLNQGTQPLALIVRPESSPVESLITSKVAQTLGRTAASLVQRLQINAVVMVGGDTAFATFQALGIHEASVTGEIMPGIAMGEMRADGRSVTFITKAGGFGDIDSLVEILQRFKNQ